jgi:hypothetical protein
MPEDPMSTVVIVALVAISLFVLVSIAVTMQTIEKNNKEKRRVESGLASRARNFQYMLEGFPKGFLSRDLQILVCKCLLDVYEQLVRLNSKKKEYKQDLARTQQKMQEFTALPARSDSITLTNTAQIKDIQKLLTSLHTFIAKLMESKRINAAEAKIYSQQIRRLMVQTSADGLTQAINEALQAGKERLALHHMRTAVDKMQKENADGFFSDRIAQYQQRIQATDTAAQKVEEESKKRRSEADAEWEEINKPDDSWKKKAIYD